MNDQFETAASDLLPCVRCGKPIPKTEQMCPYCSSIQVRAMPCYEQTERTARNIRFEVSSANPFLQIIIGDFDGRLNVAAFALTLFAVVAVSIAAFTSLGIAQIGFAMQGRGASGFFLVGILAALAAYVGIIGSVALLKERSASGNLFCCAGLSLLAGLFDQGAVILAGMFLFFIAAVMAALDSRMQQ